MKKPTLPEMLKTALYIGTIGYGGPAILALMKKVIVHQKGWVSEEEFMNALSLSQILPGATGVTLLGYSATGLKGCGAASCCPLPSLSRPWLQLPYWPGPTLPTET